MVGWKVFRRVGRKDVKYDIMYGQINVAAKAMVLEKFGAEESIGFQNFGLGLEGLVGQQDQKNLEFMGSRKNCRQTRKGGRTEDVRNDVVQSRI